MVLMPTYDYFCYVCDKRHEQYVPVDERDFVKCPHCGCRMDRLFSPPTAKAVVYAQDKNNAGWAGFTGPRQKSRKLKEMGWSEAGSETSDSLMRQQKTAEKYAQEDRDRKRNKAVDTFAKEVGGDALKAIGEALHERAENARKRGE
jgi:putative FmdB family regulatory protein